MPYRLARWFFASAVAAMLAACASPLPKVDVTPKAMAEIKTVAVIRPPEPAQYEVANFGHPGMALGLVGGLAVAADMNSKKEQLAQAYRQSSVAISSELGQRIAERLNALGFDASIEDGPWEMVEGRPTLAPEKVKSKADAVLIIYPAWIGFFATGLAGGYNNDYLPTVAIAVSISGKDRKQIYRGYHVTGWQLKNEGWRYTPPTKTFSDFDALVKNPDVSSRALMDAAAKVAISFGEDLRTQLKIGHAAAIATGTTTRAPVQAAGVRNPDTPYQLEGRAKDAYERHLARPAPRAFAITEDGRWWSAWGTKPKNPTSPKEPSLRAVPDCEAQHHTKCVLYAVDDEVVYKPAIERTEQSLAKRPD